MFGFVKKLFGSKSDRDSAKYQPTVDEINEHFTAYRSLSHDELRNKTLEFRRRIAEHLEGIDADVASLNTDADNEADIHAREAIYKEIDTLTEERDKHLEDVLRELLPEAFAVVKETARRFTENDSLTVAATQHDRDLAATPGKSYVAIEGDRAVWQSSWMAGGAEISWNMVHYDVQLIGGMVLHDGKIAEMMTGEGKTLVATLPAYLNGLSGLGVHVITVNDYLARRDQEWIGPIFEWLHLTVDCIDKHKPHSDGRVAAYKCDITYGTNNEYGFDYLRDNMVRSKADQVQGKHHFAMIDEVDSVLIDDARTPLIISGPIPKGADEQEYSQLKVHVERLLAAQRKLATQYLADAKKLFTQGDEGYEEDEAGMALLRAHRALPKYRPLIKFVSEEGVEVMLKKAENHYMQEQNKRMHLVDDPLYFTIDEKNRQVELTERGGDFLAKFVSEDNFFVMPDIALEMMQIDSDAAMSNEEKEEEKTKLSQDFSVKSKRLHAISQLLKAYTLFERDEEYVVMEGQVKIVDEQTGRMMEGRRYSDGLHQALEAKENVKIGDLTQTYATITLQNYFRMYHKLSGMTGTAETEASELWEIYKLDVVVIPTNRPIQRDDRDDLVYKTAREKYNAVIDEIEILTKAGRPVLVGTTSVDISEKLSRMLQIRNIQHNVLNAKQHQREADIVAEAGKPGRVTIATNMAGRGTDIKINEQVKTAGGLAIIGTERHDSRRVDRQLRGRAGRQGDPGSSQFYVSLEDKLMRLFKSDRIAKLMDKMGHQEGDVIQHGMVSKSIERAQKKVEENNFGIRKRLLEYDDVMNIQREAIYTKRENALSGERIAVDIANMFESLTESIVVSFQQIDDYAGFRRESMSVLGIDPAIGEGDFKSQPAEEVVQRYQEQVNAFYERKAHAIGEFLMPQIRDVHANQGHRYKRIAVPFSDGSRMLPVSADLQRAVDTNGASLMQDIEKAVTLATIDEKWKEHLRSMDELKDSSQAASFEQKDPLVVYKMEAFNLFENLIYDINEDAASYLLKGTLIFNNGQTLEEAKEQRASQVRERTRTSRAEAGSQEQQAAARQQAAAGAGGRTATKVETFKRNEKKVGRNEPCPCGSGKKFKQCHGK